MKKTASSQDRKIKSLDQTNIPQNAPADRTDSLQLLFEQNLKCLFWVENHLLVALPKMVNAASDPALEKAFATHLDITAGQVTRLEKIFSILSRPALAKKSDALEGLTMDGEHLIEETVGGSEARITGLNMAGQLVENYEITAYKGAIKLASQLGHHEISELLSETLAEEQEAEQQLLQLQEQTA